MGKYLALTLILMLSSCYKGSIFYAYTNPQISSSPPASSAAILTAPPARENASPAVTAAPSAAGTPIPVQNKPVEMIRVEGGTFLMGDNIDATPAHNVTVSSFSIGRYELDQDQYQSLTGDNPSANKGNNLPVESVSWFEAIKYCNAKNKAEGLPQAYNENTGELLNSSGQVTNDITQVKGYRLPTEAEWEYAARGGNKTGNYLFSGSDNPDQAAWYEDNSGGKTHDVGTKQPNELGIFDMNGNVSEWCTDWYNSGYYSKSPAINPTNTDPSTIRVTRSGSWLDSKENITVSSRNFHTPDFRFDYLGFRLARSGSLP